MHLAQQFWMFSHVINAFSINTITKIFCQTLTTDFITDWM